MSKKDIKYNIYATIGDRPKKLVSSDSSAFQIITDTLESINNYIYVRQDFYFDIVNYVSRDEILFVKVDDSGINVLVSWGKEWMRDELIKFGVIQDFIDKINEKLRGDIILELEMED